MNLPRSGVYLKILMVTARAFDLPNVKKYVIALCVVFACTQAIAQQHIHLDDSQSPDCLVCAHIDETPTLQTITGQAESIAYPASYQVAQQFSVAIERVYALPIRGPPQT